MGIRGTQKRKSRNASFGFLLKDLAATYSRGIYKTTTIGNAAFDGRVRNGIGSDHSFKATKKLYKDQAVPADGHRMIRPFSENYTQGYWITIRELNS